MTIAHFIMQGKGGVGKSLVSSILIQYLLKRGLQASGCDTDPVNSSLARYENLDIKVIDIMDKGGIDPVRFEELIRHIDGGPAGGHMVVDISTSCFAFLGAYLKKHNTFEMLREQGHTVYIHSIITGGVNILDTLNSLDVLFDSFAVPIVVWLNPFFGEVKIEDKVFTDLKIYQKVVDSLHGIVEMPKLSLFFARDFADMQAKHLTFEEGVHGREFFIMNRQRLVMIWRKYQQAIDALRLV